jgi:hypothetical protein
MSIQVQRSKSDLTEPLIVKVKIQGKLTKEDYSTFVSEVESLAEKGKIRIFVELVDFDGWSVGVSWQQTEFAGKRFNNIERVAVVGDKYRAKGAFLFCKPFRGATIRYYDLDNLEDSKEWICENCESTLNDLLIQK